MGDSCGKRLTAPEMIRVDASLVRTFEHNCSCPLDAHRDVFAHPLSTLIKTPPHLLHSLPLQKPKNADLLIAIKDANGAQVHHNDPTPPSQLRLLADPSRPSTPRFDSVGQERRGFVHPGLRIADGDCGLGLVSTDQIPKGSDLIGLPSHVPLRIGSVVDADNVGGGVEPALLGLVRRVPEELWAMRLGLKLLRERAMVGSFWWPYISNLPETYSVPIFFPGEDIKNLQYAPLLSQVNKRCRFLLEFEKEIKHILQDVKSDDHPFGGRDVDASSLGWAMSAVSSRAFRLHGNKLPDGTKTYIPMMLPLIDICNHSFHQNAEIVQEQDTQTSKFLVVAEKQINQNDSITLNYGCLSNDFFLLDYGFVITSNPFDCIELKYDGGLLDAASMAAGISSPNFSSPAPWQREILAQLNLEGEASILKVVEGRFLAALRVLLADDRETVEKQNLDSLQSISAEAPLGIPNEVSALRTLIALCVIALNHFPTKIMEDEALLKEGVSTSTELAVRFRMEKKSVIIDVMRNLSRRVKKLAAKETATTEC
ncbi:hypothetical protein Syun_021926 [Stephania yunnanensis]|uniref:SET domain-containing protein n=1 Tax=Stephania yunnanensis TaxID=152371 RepID=A0AAP0IGI2_9MAGN